MNEDAYVEIVRMKMRIDELERSVMTLHNAIKDRDEIIINLRNDIAYLFDMQKHG